MQLAYIPDRLFPTEDFLDPFALALACLVSFVPGRSNVDCASSLCMLRDVRRHVSRTKVFHERLDVVAFIGA